MSAALRPLDPADVAAWLTREIRSWPTTVDARQIATRVGIQVQHVHAVRNLSLNQTSKEG